MNRLVTALAFSLMAGTAFAQVPVHDATNLAIARDNAKNTNEIMKSSDEILKKSEEILKALSGSRDGSLGIGGGGLAGGMSISQAPSFGSVMNGGTLSFGDLGAQAQQIASTVINGLQLVKTIKNVIDGEDPGAVDTAYSNSVNTAALLTALTNQATEGVNARESALQFASGQIGQAEDVKGSIDGNTRIQLETARTINELIGVQNGAVQALNQEMQMRLTQMSETAKLVKYREVNPFKDLAK